MPELHKSTLSFLVNLMRKKHFKLEHTKEPDSRKRLEQELKNIDQRIELEFRYGPSVAQGEDQG